MPQTLSIKKGEKYGYWKILREEKSLPYEYINKNTGKLERCNIRRFLCLCTKCNKTERVVRRNTLNDKRSNRSCGCDQKEIASKANTTHGLSSTRINTTFKNMKNRCYNKNTKSYKDYGGRGIKICKQWLEGGLKVFASWAFANGYTDELTIDRIDNDKGYSPDNCRWTTYEKQGNNTRKNIYIVYKNAKYTFSTFHQKFGSNKYATALYRYNVLKLSPIEAVSGQKIKKLGKYLEKEVEYKGVKYNFYELWKKFGKINLVTARRRFARGVDPYLAVTQEAYEEHKTKLKYYLERQPSFHFSTKRNKLRHKDMGA